jgi:hypothetical protein
MNDSELIEFYENIDKLTSFYRIRTVYNLTNNLDIHLLRFLRKDFFLYHMNKARTIMERNEEGISDEIELWFTDVTVWNDYKYQMADLQDYFDFTFGDSNYLTDFFGKAEIFYPELYELEGIAIGRLSKNKEQSELYDELLEEYNVPIVKRIIYLEKLGILDFLRKSSPFNTSINMMANILGSIIDAKPSTIQPLLNPLLGKDVDNKNNPLNSAKNVMAVENQLINIGYTDKTIKNL